MSLKEYKSKHISVSCITKNNIMFYFRTQAGAPSNKIILGIATFGRTWKMDSESEIAGVPPIHVDGPGEAGKAFSSIHIKNK